MSGSSIKNPAKITLRNIFAVLQAFGRRTREMIGMKLPTHMWEQIVWRRTQVIEKSPECWNKGNCQECGCEILGKTMEDRECSKAEDPCYPAMMNEHSWEIYKRINNIKLFN